MLAIQTAPKQGQGRDIGRVIPPHPAPSTQPDPHTCKRFAGGTHQVTTAQICMAWSLFQTGAISKLGLRITFAAHEMACQRRFGNADKPLYRLAQIKALVGGRGTKTADTAIRAATRQLARCGLVEIDNHTIRFARHIEDLKEAHQGAARDMLALLDHKQRQVPIPRRMLRSLAAGFGRAQTAVILAKLIRGCFWKRKEGCYRIDGRTKASWIAKRFGISKSAAEKARVHLIELGWLRELPTHQIMRNRWGSYDLIEPAWQPANSQEPLPESRQDAIPKAPAKEQANGGESATPQAHFEGESATPIKQDALPQEEELRNRKLRGKALNPSGSSIEDQLGDRKMKPGKRKRTGPPNIRDIQPEDLRDTQRLCQLHSQATKMGLAEPGDGGQLEFFALAERVRSRATFNPGGMLWRLLKDQKWSFITQVDEDAANARQKELLYGKTDRHPSGGGGESTQFQPLSLEERQVQAILRSTRGREEPELLRRLAKETLGWDADQWDQAHFAFTTRNHRRPEGEPQSLGVLAQHSGFPLMNTSAGTTTRRKGPNSFGAQGGKVD